MTRIHLQILEYLLKKFKSQLERNIPYQNRFSTLNQFFLMSEPIRESEYSQQVKKFLLTNNESKEHGRNKDSCKSLNDLQDWAFKPVQSQQSLQLRPMMCNGTYVAWLSLFSSFLYNVKVVNVIFLACSHWKTQSQ